MTISRSTLTHNLDSSNELPKPRSPVTTAGPRAASSGLVAGTDKYPESIRNPDPSIYRTGKGLAVDFEIGGGFEYGSPYHKENRLVLACWMELFPLSGKGQSSPVIHSEWGGEYEQSRLFAAIGRADFIVAHNAKFELAWLSRCGLDLRKIRSYCTQIGEWCLLPNRPRPLSLDSTAKRYGLAGKSRFAACLIHSGVDPSEIPKPVLEEYCKNDVYLTASVFRQQVDRLALRGLLPVAYQRNLITPCLASIEVRGMQLDATRVRSAAKSCNTEYAALHGRLEEITGGINFRSGKQLGQYLYGTLGFDEERDYRGNIVKTGAGKPKTDKHTIHKLKARTDAQRAFKGCIEKLLPLKKKVQILDNMVECCNKDGGRIFFTFHQTITQTGRLSSTGGKYGFSAHTSPRELKSLFQASEEGWLIGEADARQLEFCCAVDMARDNAGIADIVAGVDIHSFTAEVMGVGRQNAKKYTFKPLYGGNSGSPKEKAYYKAFREKYKTLYNAQNGWVLEVVKTKELRTPSGLIYYFPDTEVSKSGYITNTPSIFNYPVQGFATADIIPLTLVLIWYMLEGMETRIVNTIHDSVICEIHPDEVDKYEQIIKKAFCQDIYWLLKKLYNYDFITPIGVEGKIGAHWGESERGNFNHEGNSSEHSAPAVERQGISLLCPNGGSGVL